MVTQQLTTIIETRKALKHFSHLQQTPAVAAHCDALRERIQLLENIRKWESAKRQVNSVMGILGE